MSETEQKYVCPKCNTALRANARSIQCDGFCKEWFHISCIGISEQLYNAMKKNYNDTQEDKLLWFCDADRVNLEQLLAGENNETNYMNTSTCNIKMDAIEAKVDKILKKIENKKTENEKIPTYADIVKKKPVKKNIPSIIIRPKNNAETSEKTEMKIKQKIDPSSIGISVDYMGKIRKGGIFIKTKTEEHANKLLDTAKAEIGSEYEISRTKMRMPRVIARGVLERYETTDGPKLLSALINQNAQFNDEDLIKIVYVKEINGKFNYVLECSASTYQKIVNRYVNIGWKSYYIKEHIYVTRCNKCQGFNHIAKFCEKTVQNCAKCAGEHKTMECNSDKMKCINCAANPTQNCNHYASSHDCPIFLDQISRAKNKISY